MNIPFVSARRLRRFVSVAAVFTAAIAHSATPTTIATGLGGPIGMTLDSAGDLIVADLELDAVVKISRSGTASVIGLVDGAYMPRYDASGNLYVTSFKNDGALVRFDPNGAMSTVVTGLSAPAGFWIEPAGTIVLAQASGVDGIVRIDLANGITPLGISAGYEAIFDPAGRLLVSRFGSGTVTRYALPSTTGTTVASGLNGVGGLAFDTSGDLYVAVQSSGNIVRIPSSGPAVDFVTGLHSPRGLAFDSAGGLFVSNRLDGTIQRIGTDTTAPVVSVPGTITVAATGPSGAAVTFSASALDDVPGIFDVTLSHASGSNFPIGTTTVTASATDPAGNTGTASFQIVVVAAPIVKISSPVSGSLQQVNQNVGFEGSFTSAGVVGTYTARWTFTSAMLSAPIELPGTVVGSDVFLTHAFTTPGVYSVRLTVTDPLGTTGSAAVVGDDPDADAFVVIYDPNGAFVTGGGWIWSPQGAYALDASIEGRANFGFVSKYKKGATIPEGNTEFQFNAGGLNFHSNEYQWLVVASTRAQFKGQGAINGTAGFSFLLTAIDGKPQTAQPADLFRIKIWDTASGEIVYDNQTGSDDDAPLGVTTALRGGNISIQTR